MADFENKYRYTELAPRVVAVAVITVNTKTGEYFDWTAYIDAVPGRCHKEEFMAVAANGSKLPVDVAAILFPGFSRTKYRG